MQNMVNIGAKMSVVYKTFSQVQLAAPMLE